MKAPTFLADDLAGLHAWGAQVNVTHPCDVYPCTDGSIYLAIALDSDWRRLCEVVGRPDLARAPGFGRNAERLSNRGADNDAVLDELGYDSDRRAELRADRVI